MSNDNKKDFECCCSFCGKTKELARKLVAGPNGVYICDDCIEICQEVLKIEEEMFGKKRKDELDRTPLEFMFSITNTKDKTHKIITILGLTIKIKRSWFN